VGHCHIAGLPPNAANKRPTIGFEQVPDLFRSLLKEYVATLLLVHHHAPAHCVNELRWVTLFLTFYLQRHPTAADLTDLTATDVEVWAAQLRAVPNARFPSTEVTMSLITSTKSLSNA